MADAVKAANRLKCEEIIKNLKKRGMNGGNRRSHASCGASYVIASPGASC